MINRIENTVIDGVMWHIVKRHIKTLLPSETGHPIYDGITTIITRHLNPAKQIILQRLNVKRLN